jgi:hypothetical protein
MLFLSAESTIVDRDGKRTPIATWCGDLPDSRQLGKGNDRAEVCLTIVRGLRKRRSLSLEGLYGRGGISASRTPSQTSQHC